MNKPIRHRLGSLLAGALLGLAALPAVADDTELFVASSDPSITGAQPNILFIYDNSGSMNSEVLTQEAWDPDLEFEGCYEPDGLYFSTSGTMPACGSNDYIHADVNQCAASFTPLRTVGTFSDRMLAWRGSNYTWNNLNGSRKSRPMECQDDRGVHGADDSSAEVYAAAGSTGPYDATSTNEPSWNTDYTVWSGNWLNWYTSDGTVTKTRMEIVREVTINLLDSLNGVNVGLMHFNTTQGGTVRQALTDIATSRADMQAAVASLTASTWTPLSETLYEATNYWMGRDVDYGNTGPVLSVGASRTSGTTGGTTYLKPTTYSCQKNYIVFLTDGLPTQDVDAVTKIKALPDWAANVTDATCSGTPGSNGECMSDLAEYLYRHDLDSGLAGLQNVTTYTIGFGVDLALGDTTFLQQTALKGGGQYFPAGDTATLQNALTQIVLDILDDSTTFSTPTAPVNAFNRTQNLSDVFVSVFAPAVREHWPGNLKKYRLQGGRLVDANGANAVDPDTGFFAGNSQSFWSDATDGNDARQGGAAHELPVHASRNLYTSIAGADLNASGNAVATDNAALTAALIGTSDAEREKVIEWARGLDLLDEDDDGATDDVRHVMGDPLHVRPVMVIYGGTAAAPDATVFVSTNDGYLHAIDPDDGSELWAFIPQELLGRLNDLYLNDTTSARTYGLDGEITVWIEENDQVAGIAGDERVLLYFGMRRGGDTLYALDVTDRENPQIAWQIDGEDEGFESLGQTWSPPVVTTVNVNGTERRVAIFGGGYDDGQDEPGYKVDSKGNAIFMVDALTGELVWSAGPGADRDLELDSMEHSIPAGIRVLDLDQDGLADRMYAGDMGGRVWRFDIVNGEPVGDLVVGGVFASLGAADLDSPQLPDVRRFYATPDVARIITNNRVYLSINIGSGHREHPLDTATEDEFYALRDYGVYDVIPSEDYDDPITRDDLEDITFTTDPEMPYDTNGWRLGMVLSPGEKVLTESRTFANTVFFTSFSPGGNGDACVAAGGLNRLYVISVRDGSPLTNLDGSEDPETLSVEDRVRELNQGGIAPDPALFFSASDDDDDPQAECLGDTCAADDDDGSDVTLCLGVECFDPGFANPPRRTRWNQNGTE
jgi:type IV pilus assembly protein PilY1